MFKLRIGTLNCNFPKGVPWQKRLIREALGDMQPDILSLQELRHSVKAPDYHIVQGFRANGEPNGEALLINDRLLIRDSGIEPAFTDRQGQTINLRVLPWAVVVLPITPHPKTGVRSKSLLAIGNHRPPHRMQNTNLDEKNDESIKHLLTKHRGVYHKVIAGDLNNTGDPDPYNLPRWTYWGRGIDEVVTNPRLSNNKTKVNTYNYPTNDGHHGTFVDFVWK